MMTNMKLLKASQIRVLYAASSELMAAYSPREITYQFHPFSSAQPAAFWAFQPVSSVDPDLG